MSAIGALETVALTQVYRDEPTLPVSDYPNFSATTIVRRMTGERLMLCRMRLMAHESSNCVGFQRGTPSNQGQTTEDDSSHDYRTLSQPTGSAASPCNACAGASVAGCCNDTSTACAGSSGCPHFGQFMRKVSYGARRWRLAASRNSRRARPRPQRSVSALYPIMNAGTGLPRFCELHQIGRLRSQSQLNAYRSRFSRGNAIARILEQALLLRCPVELAPCRRGTNGRSPRTISPGAPINL